MTPGREFVFAPGRAPFRSCHAATIAETAPGEYCVAWFGGTKEGAADVGIWLARRRGGAWSAPACVARVRNEAHWNPVLFYDAASDETHLFFKVGMQIPSWETWVMRSRDGGKTWSEAVELVPGDRGGRGPCKNKPISLTNGDWLAPASLEGDRWAAFVDRSQDRGRTWAVGPVIPLDRKRLPAGGVPGRIEGVIQPTLWESAPGQVHMLLRSTFGYICRSDSTDFGRTWCGIYVTDLPNNNSGLDLAQLPDGRLVLVCNPVAENWGPRTPLTIFSSDDNGRSWSRMEDLEAEPVRGDERPRPEFSYPSIIPCSEGVAIVYTWKRMSIAIAMRR